MVEADGGSIINISSVAGMNGSGDTPTYCASKGAVRLLIYSLADRLGGEGIRVNAIHPGISNTQMMESSSLGQGFKGHVRSAVIKKMIPQGALARQTRSPMQHSFCQVT